MIDQLKISIVLPCFNEQGNIKVITEKLIAILHKYSDYELIFVDDGSTDNSLSIIKELVQTNPKIKYLSFSRNFGHQNALKAGMDVSHGDCLITMDADLQHPPELIPTMIEKWLEGYDVVYTMRNDTEKTSFFKRLTARIFYYLINKISNIEIPSGTADFRLMDKRVVEIFKSFQESFIFIRGLIAWMGFKQYGLVYIPQERFSGQTKYSLKGMIFLALSGITAFSVRPLHLATILGLILAGLSIIYGIYAVCITIFTHRVISGWASVIVSVLFIGSVQLIILGIIGEYLGKLFIASKNRPNYIIKEKSF
ncbi:MAG: glycosyltransferase family 2 protein [bacterium]